MSKAGNTNPTAVPVKHRDNGNKAAIVFIHGFSGDAVATWGNFPAHLSQDPKLQEWDIYSLGYPTSLMPDIKGIWSADPDLTILSTEFRTRAKLSPFDKYARLALVGHSMGGLILQHAVVEEHSIELLNRVSHILLFGTPSGGLAKASLLAFWKPQIRDMASGSPFISELRNSWQKFKVPQYPFTFWAVAGDRDEFVPSQSSLVPFDTRYHAVIPGNHLEIVKPETPQENSVQIVLNAIAGNANTAGPGNSARVALEMKEFQEVIQRFEPGKEGLDAAARVQLALAYESVNRQKDAIQLLEGSKGINTDLMGVLAGRLKRRWLVERQEVDAQRSRTLYVQALAISETKSDYPQAFYHGINVAFLDIAYGRDRASAEYMAKRVLEFCKKSPADKWRYATEGEALLVLGDRKKSIECYRLAVKANPAPRELDSMYQQLIHLLSLLGDEETGKELENIFKGKG